jgi:hypothetical protein
MYLISSLPEPILSSERLSERYPLPSQLQLQLLQKRRKKLLKRGWLVSRSKKKIKTPESNEN